MEAGENGNDIVQKISDNIQQLEIYVKSFTVFVEKIGSAEDTEQMRISMSELIQQSNSLSKTTSELIKQLVNVSNSDRFYRVYQERFMNEYMKVLNHLQTEQRRAALKEKAQIKSVTAEDEMLSASQDDILNESEKKRQLQEQHRIHLNEIRERQQTLFQLESDISDANQIFKDLARIVHDQGEIVDSIEANIEHASIHVEQSYVHTQQALYYNSKANQKKIFIIIFLIVLIAILLLFSYLWTR